MISKKNQVLAGKQSKSLYDPEGLFARVSEALANGGVARWNRKKSSLYSTAKLEQLQKGFADADFSGLDLSGINLNVFFSGDVILAEQTWQKQTFVMSRCGRQILSL